MNLKSLLIGSAAALVSAAPAAHAADVIVAPEPEAVEYVRVCDAYGAGYFYIPGTETCLRIHGYVRYDLKGGDNVYARVPVDTTYRGLKLAGKKRDTWDNKARATVRFSTASETELGTLKTFVETRYDWGNGEDTDTGSLRYGYIQLGGLRVGLDESNFVTFTGYLGDVINDDVILAGGYRTTAIAYTFAAGNGFSAMIAAEQGNNTDVDVITSIDQKGKRFTSAGKIDDYTPHIVGGLKYEGGWGKIAGVAAYDALNEEWAGKVRADVNLTDTFAIWAQGGYKSNDDRYTGGYRDAYGKYRDSVRVIDSFYGTWGGDWAVWAGAKWKATEKATFNVQAAYEGAKTFAATANVAYELVPGFTVTPEVSYTKWDDSKSILKGMDAVSGAVRFQRSF